MIFQEGLEDFQRASETFQDPSRRCALQGAREGFRRHLRMFQRISRMYLWYYRSVFGFLRSQVRYMRLKGVSYGFWCCSEML